MKNCELYLGDCLEQMNNIADDSVDMILCDLPYGTTSCSWDIIIPFDQLWKQYNRITKKNAAILLFGQEPFSSYLRLSNIQNYRYDIYWEKEKLTNILQVKYRVGKTVETISVFYKTQCTYHPKMKQYIGEPVVNSVKNGKLGTLVDSGTKKVKEYTDTGYRYPTQVWKYKRDLQTSNLHPTQKPLKLCEDLISTFSNRDDTVLDNCMGSGTTGVACQNLNRKFIGIEIDENYFQIAEKRLKENERQLNPLGM